MPNNINRYEVRFHLTKTETNMNKNEIINELNKIEDMLTENNLSIEVVANYRNPIFVLPLRDTAVHDNFYNLIKAQKHVIPKA